MFLEVASKNWKSFHYTTYPQVFHIVILFKSATKKIKIKYLFCQYLKEIATKNFFGN